MSTKEIANRFGDKIAVTDNHGGPLAIRIETTDVRDLSISISVEEGRKLARALDAFAEIHTV